MKFAKQFVFVYGLVGTLIISSFLRYDIGTDRSSFTSHTQKLDRLYLQVDFETERPFMLPAMFRTDKQSIYYYNKKTNALKVYDLEGGHVKNTISLEKIWFEFENFHVISPDSILLYTKYRRNNLYLINGQGERLSVYKNWPRDSVRIEIPRMVGSKDASIVHLDSLVFIAHQINQPEIHETYSTISVINLNSQEVELLEGIPKIGDLTDPWRMANINTYWLPSLATDKEKGVLVSYGLSQELFQLDLTDSSLSKKTTDVEGFQAHKGFSQDIRNISSEAYEYESRDASILSGQFKSIFYNPSKAVYYRVIKMPYDEGLLKRHRDDESVRLTPFSYTVLKLDRNMNVLDQKDYPDSPFKWDLGSFVTSEGLWVMEDDWRNTNEMVFVKVME